MSPERPHILVVEDDATHIMLLQRAFRKAELDIPLRFAENGAEAVDYLSGVGAYSDRSANPMPTLILLDLNLPLKSGFEVLEFIRRDERLRRLPVVVMSTSKESVDVNRAYDLGANSYVAKPIDFQALVQIVRTLDTYWLRLNELPELRVG